MSRVIQRRLKGVLRYLDEYFKRMSKVSKRIPKGDSRDFKIVFKKYQSVKCVSRKFKKKVSIAFQECLFLVIVRVF